ncbi:RNA-binding protein like, partial [Actinidia chinensis var. chinensis]
LKYQRCKFYIASALPVDEGDDIATPIEDAMHALTHPPSTSIPAGLFHYSRPSPIHPITTTKRPLHTHAQERVFKSRNLFLVHNGETIETVAKGLGLARGGGKGRGLGWHGGDRASSRRTMAIITGDG